MTNPLAVYLDVPEEYQEEFEQNFDSDCLQEDTGSSGDMVYQYLFTVPCGFSEAFLSQMEWEKGVQIEIPIHIIDYDE